MKFENVMEIGKIFEEETVGAAIQRYVSVLNPEVKKIDMELLEFLREWNLVKSKSQFTSLSSISEIMQWGMREGKLFTNVNCYAFTKDTFSKENRLVAFGTVRDTFKAFCDELEKEVPAADTITLCVTHKGENYKVEAQFCDIRFKNDMFQNLADMLDGKEEKQDIVALQKGLMDMKEKFDRRQDEFYEEENKERELKISTLQKNNTLQKLKEMRDSITEESFDARKDEFYLLGDAIKSYPQNLLSQENGLLESGQEVTGLQTVRRPGRCR